MSSKSSATSTCSSGSVCASVTLCRFRNSIGSTALIIRVLVGKLPSFNAGVNVKVATATSLPFRNPPRRIVHWTAESTTLSPLLAAQPKKKVWKSKGLALLAVVMVAVPFGGSLLDGADDEVRGRVGGCAAEGEAEGGAAEDEGVEEETFLDAHGVEGGDAGDYFAFIELGLGVSGGG